jgi:low affinity Fe/Cu permease
MAASLRELFLAPAPRFRRTRHFRRRGGDMAERRGFTEWFEEFSHRVTHATGRPWAFLVASLVIIIWALTGPFFGFGDTWQLVINTSTTIVTFLMVFLIQQTQNKDSKAVELKLNELVASTKGASNRLIDVESLTEEELDVLHGYFRELATLARKDVNMTDSHSIEEARRLHTEKTR